MIPAYTKVSYFLTIVGERKKKKTNNNNNNKIKEWMNEWCFKARRQLRSYWAHLHIKH